MNDEKVRQTSSNNYKISDNCQYYDSEHYYLSHGGYVFAATNQYDQMIMKVSGNVDNETRNRQLHFGDVPDYFPDCSCQ